MEPITATIITALVGGAIEVFKPTATQAVKDAYGKLKGSLVKKFGKDSDVAGAIRKVEEQPESADHQALLEGELTAVQDQLEEEQEELAKALTQTIISYQATVGEGGTAVQGEGNVVAGSGSVAVGGDLQGNITMGDTIAGDYVKGDKVQGDKVLGDKIGSQVNTGGGAYFGGPASAGGDLVAGDQHKTIHGSTASGKSAFDYDALFAPLLAIAVRQDPALSAKVNSLKEQVAKGAGADDESVAGLLQDITEAAPQTKPVVVALFDVPAVAEAAGPAARYVLKRMN